VYCRALPLGWGNAAHRNEISAEVASIRVSHCVRDLFDGGAAIKKFYRAKYTPLT
jgi:hypothetical protein